MRSRARNAPHDASYTAGTSPYPMAAPTQPNADNQTQTWPELAIGLYDKLTGRGAEIVYEFDDFHLSVPSGTGPNATHADWKMSGAVRIRTRDDEHGGSADKK